MYLFDVEVKHGTQVDAASPYVEDHDEFIEAVMKYVRQYEPGVSIINANHVLTSFLENIRGYDYSEHGKPIVQGELQRLRSAYPEACYNYTLKQVMGHTGSHIIYNITEADRLSWEDSDDKMDHFIVDGGDKDPKMTALKILLFVQETITPRL